jgi:type IV pilus assembly protein PilV
MRRGFKGKDKTLMIAKNDGFTLLEVLISVVILGVSLLAIASGEVTSLNTGRGSREISMAAASGQEIFERIRRNRENILSYNGFDTSNSATRPGAAGMLQTDYDEWEANVEMIGGGRGQITVAAGTPIASTDQVTVTITTSSRTITLQAVF